MYTEEQKEMIAKMIRTLFNSRNKEPVELLPKIWYNALSEKKYDFNNIKTVFTWLLYNGSDFPTLTEVISLLDSKKSPDVEALEAWSSVLKAVKERKGSIMTDRTKKVYDMLCADGITTYIEADNYQRGQIERDFKTLYKSYAEGSIKPKLEHKPSDQLDMDFTKKQINGTNA